MLGWTDLSFDELKEKLAKQSTFARIAKHYF